MCDKQCADKEAEIEEGGVDPLSLASFAAERGFDPATRTIFLNGEITQETFKQIQQAINFLSMAAGEPIQLHLNSPGGSVYAAVGIVGLMRTCPCPITVVSFGLVASAATLIMAAGHTRISSEFCWFMSHGFSYGEEGKHAEIQANVAQVDREFKQWAKWMERYTKTSAQAWMETGKAIDYWFTPAEAKKMGLIDKVLKG